MTTAQEILSDISAYLVKFEDFEIVKKIGEGAFGVVYLAIHKNTGIKCAVKKLLTEELEDEELLYFCREVKILACCNSFFLLPLMGFAYTKPYLIVTEFMPCGSLFDALHHKNGAPQLSQTDKNVIAMGIAHGMMRLHRMKIIHRDLKSLNILLDQKHHPKICDFGIARFKDDTTSLVTKQIGTTQWMAPEQLMTATYSNKVDVYAYGVLLWEICSEDIPFRGMTNVQIAIQVCEKNVRPKIPENVPKRLHQLIQLCWHKDPNKRPSFKQIYQSFASHKVAFDDVDFNAFDQVVSEVEAAEPTLNTGNPLSTRANISEESFQTIRLETLTKYKPEKAKKLSQIQKPLNIPPPQDNTTQETPQETQQSTANLLPPSQFDANNTNNEINSNQHNEISTSSNYEEDDEEEEYGEEEDDLSNFEHHIFDNLYRINADNIKRFYESIIEFIVSKNPPQAKRELCIKAISQVVEKDQNYAAPLIETGIFDKLPLTNDKVFPLVVKIISAMIAANPNAITPELTQTLATMADKFTAEILHIFSKYALVAESQPNAFAVISPFLAVSSSYLTRGFTTDFVRIIVFLLGINDNFQKEYKHYSFDLIKHVLQHGQSDEIDYCYNALSLAPSILPQIPMDILISHINTTHTPSLVTYLINADVKPTGELISALLPAATNDQCALAALCHIAQSASGSVLMMLNKEWISPECNPYISFFIFLSLLTNSAMPPALAELDGIPELLLRAASTYQKDVLIAIETALTKLPLSGELINKLSSSQFFKVYLQNTIGSAEGDLANSGFRCLSHITDTSFPEETLNIARAIVQYISPVNEATREALSTAIKLARNQSCLNAMKETDLKTALESTQFPPEYNTLKQELFSLL